MESIKRFLTIPVLILLSSTMMLSAAEQNKKIETAYPVASTILIDAYRYLGGIGLFFF